MSSVTKTNVFVSSLPYRSSYWSCSQRYSNTIAVFKYAYFPTTKAVVKKSSSLCLNS